MVLHFVKFEKKTPASIYKATSILSPRSSENPSCKVEAKKPWQRRQGEGYPIVTPVALPIDGTTAHLASAVNAMATLHC